MQNHVTEDEAKKSQVIEGRILPRFRTLTNGFDLDDRRRNFIQENLTESQLAALADYLDDLNYETVKDDTRKVTLAVQAAIDAAGFSFSN